MASTLWNITFYHLKTTMLFDDHVDLFDFLDIHSDDSLLIKYKFISYLAFSAKLWLHSVGGECLKWFEPPQNQFVNSKSSGFSVENGFVSSTFELKTSNFLFRHPQKAQFWADLSLVVSRWDCLVSFWGWLWPQIF